MSRYTPSSCQKQTVGKTGKKKNSAVFKDRSHTSDSGVQW